MTGAFDVWGDIREGGAGSKQERVKGDKQESKYGIRARNL